MAQSDIPTHLLIQSPKADQMTVLKSDSAAESRSGAFGVSAAWT